MYRTTGLVILGVGAILTFTMVFTGFEHAVKSWEVDQATGDVSQVTIDCTAPFGIVLGDGEQNAVPSWGAHLCAATGQRLFITGTGIFIVALGLGLWGIRRGPKPKTKSIETLPSFGGGNGEKAAQKDAGIVDRSD